MSQQTEVKLSYRDCQIMYNVDRFSVAQMAAHFGIDWADMKKALRDYGFTVRKGEEKPADPVKSYKVILVDTDKIVVEEAPKAKTTATTTTNTDVLDAPATPVTVVTESIDIEG